MERVKLAPALFALALVMFLLPFFTIGIAPSDDAIDELVDEWSFSEIGVLKNVKISMTVSGLEMAQLSQSATDKDAEAATKDIAEAGENSFKDIVDSGDEPSAEDINQALSDFTSEAKAPLLVCARAALSEDGELVKDLEKAAKDTDDEESVKLLDQLLGFRKKVKTGAAALMVTAVLLLAGAVLGFVNGANTQKYSSYAGAAGAVVLALVAALGIASETIEYQGMELLTVAITPGVGLIVSVVAAAAGAFMAFRSQQSLAPVYAAPAAPFPAPVEMPPLETLPAEPVPAPSTAATVMESNPVAGPAWGATVIEDHASLPGLFASLRVVAGAGIGRGYDVRAEGETRLGRDAAMNDIVVSDAKASGQHAKLRFENGGFTLFDLGSTNGTFVNDVQVLAPVVLKMDDKVKIGDTVMVFQVAQA